MRFEAGDNIIHITPTSPSEKAITEAIKFLGWVSDSYLAHAKCTDVTDEIIAYEGSAEMAREHAAALSVPAPGALDSASPEPWEMSQVQSHVGHSIKNDTWFVRFYPFASEAAAKAFESNHISIVAVKALEWGEPLTSDFQILDDVGGGP